MYSQTARRRAAPCISCLFALATLIFPCASAFAAGSAEKAVFYLDKGGPVVRLDRIPKSGGIKAILAMYALENGAGCEGKNDQGLVKCALTEELGLGANCSEEHIRFVGSWFTKTPNLTSRWNEKWNGDAKNHNVLKALCYGQPDTASWQNIWEIIRVGISNDVVTVDAIFTGGSQHGRTRARYTTSYRIGPQEVIELESKMTVLESSQKSLFED